MLTAVETVTDVHIAPVDSDFETEVDPPGTWIFFKKSNSGVD